MYPAKDSYSAISSFIKTFSIGGVGAGVDEASVSGIDSLIHWRIVDCN